MAKKEKEYTIDEVVEGFKAVRHFMQNASSYYFEYLKTAPVVLESAEKEFAYSKEILVAAEKYLSDTNEMQNSQTKQLARKRK